LYERALIPCAVRSDSLDRVRSSVGTEEDFRNAPRVRSCHTNDWYDEFDCRMRRRWNDKDGWWTSYAVVYMEEHHAMSLRAACTYHWTDSNVGPSRWAMSRYIWRHSKNRRSSFDCVPYNVVCDVIEMILSARGTLRSRIHKKATIGLYRNLFGWKRFIKLIHYRVCVSKRCRTIYIRGGNRRY
jgi:hypothetical protein